MVTFVAEYGLDVLAGELNERFAFFFFDIVLFAQMPALQAPKAAPDRDRRHRSGGARDAAALHAGDGLCCARPAAARGQLSVRSF